MSNYVNILSNIVAKLMFVTVKVSVNIEYGDHNHCYQAYTLSEKLSISLSNQICHCLACEKTFKAIGQTDLYTQ